MSYYDPADITGAGAVYINKIDFRYVKIKGPYTETVAECAGLTLAIKDEDVTKMNFYCYDPLQAIFICFPMFVN